MSKMHRTFLWLLAVTLAGLATKFYQGPFHSWVNNSAGGILYVIFFCLLSSLIFPGARSVMIALAVFTGTSLLEILQLWHPVWLESIRNSFAGAILIGSTFSWLDFPHYAIGSLIAWLFLPRLRQTRDTLPDADGRPTH